MSDLVARVVNNVSWMFIDKGLRIFVGLMVFSLMARSLGPETFGLFNYVLALVSIFNAIAALGLNGIVVRELADAPNQAGNIVGSAFYLSVASASLSYLLIVLSVVCFNSGQGDVLFLSLIIGWSVVFGSMNVFKYWFEWKVDLRAVVIWSIGVFLCFSFMKLVLIIFNKNVFYFAAVTVFEAAALGGGWWWLYTKKQDKNISFKIDVAIRLLKESWPLLIASAAWMVYTRIDQVMIGIMLSDREVGYYSVAMKINDVLALFPFVIVTVAAPAIMKFKQSNREMYERKFQLIYDFVVWLMIFLAIVVTLSASSLVKIFFGDIYSESAKVMAISSWSCLFIGLATVSGRFLLNEGMQIITMYRHLIGVFISVVLNYFFIPIYGIEGAAVSTLISIVVSNYFLDAIFSSTRQCFYQKTKSILAKELRLYLYNQK